MYLTFCACWHKLSISNMYKQFRELMRGGSFVLVRSITQNEGVLIIQRHTRRNQNKCWCFCHPLRLRRGPVRQWRPRCAWLEFLSCAEGSWLEEIKIIILGRAPHRGTMPPLYPTDVKISGNAHKEGGSPETEAAPSWSRRAGKQWIR